MKSFAVVPAAGCSRRMGTAKLLLPWQDQGSLLDHTLTRWRAAQVTCVVVVTPSLQHDTALAQAIVERAKAHGAVAVVPEEQPPDMKHSVLLALRFLRETLHPNPHDVWLLAPADMPCWSPRVVERLLEVAENNPGLTILVPTFHQRRGHPVLFRWPIADEIEQLAADEGVNVVVKRHGYTELPWDDNSILLDVDTWHAYATLQQGTPPGGPIEPLPNSPQNQDNG